MRKPFTLAALLATALFSGCANPQKLAWKNEIRELPVAATAPQPAPQQYAQQYAQQYVQQTAYTGTQSALSQPTRGSRSPFATAALRGSQRC